MPHLSFCLDKTKRPLLIAAAVILLLGTAVRWAGLDRHFTHCDDIGAAKTLLGYQQSPGYDLEKMHAVIHMEPPSDPVTAAGYWMARQMEKAGLLPTTLAIRNQFYRMTAVSRFWTYAPLQYAVTYFLLKPGMEYRSLLYWGRFPSLIFSVAALVFMLFFYWKWQRFRSPSFLLALALMAFSWQNIIYAKQMSSYAIGVFAVTVILYILMKGMKLREYSAVHLAGLAAFLALLSYGQYQVVFIVAAFFAAFAFAYLLKKKPWKSLLEDFFILGITYAVLTAPLYFLFLKRHSHRGINWNAGPNNEYLFSFDTGAGIVEKITGCTAFFIKNLFTVLGSNTGFTPEDSLPYVVFHWIIAFLFLTGLVNFIRTKSPKKKVLGVHIAVVAVIWTLLIIKQKLTLSPTRHSMILAPYFAIIIAEGFDWVVSIARRFRVNARWTRAIRRYAWIGIAGLFLVFYPNVSTSRLDPFDEKEILKILGKFNVDTVIATEFTWNLAYFPGLTKRHNYFEEYGQYFSYKVTEDVPYRVIAFLSHRRKLTEETFNRMRNEINAYQMQRLGNTEAVLPYLLTGQWENYKRVYQQEIESDIEVDFSKRTKNGSNNFFFYILEKTA